ncbi:MAG: HSP40/DnaJ peptide-binding protein [bacterium]|nr:HSP40/DnaJ peptide-binding protein [bacterium]
MGGGFSFETRGGRGFSDFFEALFGGLGGGRAAEGFGPPGGDNGPDPFATEFTRREQDAGFAGAALGNVETTLSIPLEDAFRGATRRISFMRTDPAGHATRQTYDVKIPAGIREGQKIRLKGQGSQVGRQAGDILITIMIASHPRFRVDGDNLEADLPVTPWEAALGGHVGVETIDAARVEVKIPPGIQSGQRLRVRGRGMPRSGGARGDMMLRVVIQVPKPLSEQEKELFEKLAKVSRFDPRQA